MLIPFVKGSFLEDGILLGMIEKLLYLYHSTLYLDDLTTIENRLTVVFSEMVKYKQELNLNDVLCFIHHFSLQQFKYIKNKERISAWSDVKKYAENNMTESHDVVFYRVKEFISNFENILDKKNEIKRKQIL